MGKVRSALNPSIIPMKVVPSKYILGAILNS